VSTPNEPGFSGKPDERWLRTDGPLIEENAVVDAGEGRARRFDARKDRHERIIGHLDDGLGNKAGYGRILVRWQDERPWGSPASDPAADFRAAKGAAFACEPQHLVTNDPRLMAAWALAHNDPPWHDRDVAADVQGSVERFGLLARLRMAWRVLRGRPMFDAEPLSYTERFEHRDGYAP
jgi:hypothetical protein